MWKPSHSGPHPSCSTPEKTLKIEKKFVTFAHPSYLPNHSPPPSTIPLPLYSNHPTTSSWSLKNFYTILEPAIFAIYHWRSLPCHCLKTWDHSLARNTRQRGVSPQIRRWRFQVPAWNITLSLPFVFHKTEDDYGTGVWRTHCSFYLIYFTYYIATFTETTIWQEGFFPS